MFSVVCTRWIEGRTRRMPGSAGTGSQSHRLQHPPSCALHPGLISHHRCHREGTGRSHQLTQPALGTNQQNEREALLWAQGKDGMSYRLPCLSGRELLAPDTGLCSSVCPEAGLRPSYWGEPSGTRGSGTRAIPQPADFSSLPHEIKRLS